MIYKLIPKVWKIKGIFKENDKNHGVIEDQMRCIIKYLMYKFIAEKNECTVQEISKEFGIIENTVYKYIKIGAKIGYLKKVNNDADLRRVIVVAGPKINKFLEEYERIVSTFYQKIILESKNLL